MVELIGWVGSICFAICALPQALQSYRQKNSNGISWGFLLLWLIGEILTLAYVTLTTVQLPLITNYVLNFLFLVVILWFKIFPKSK
jgi:uncharacterized protein with PQ loop repeat